MCVCLSVVFIIHTCRSLPAPALFNKYAAPSLTSSSTLSPADEPVVFYRLNPIEFDKDQDSHMRVVAAASNLRARNYSIKEEDLHTSR